MFELLKNIGSSTILGLLVFLSLSLCLTNANQAQTIAELEAELKNLYGLDKLKALNKISPHYQMQNSRKAIKFGRQAVALGENIFIETNADIKEEDWVHMVQSYFQMGEIWFKRGHYFQSKEQLESAILLSDKINNDTYVEDAEKMLEEIQGFVEAGEIKEDFFSKTFRNIKIGEVVNNASRDIGIESEITIGKAKEKKGDFRGAISHYGNAINSLANRGDSEGINELQLKIASLLDSLSEHEEAQKFLNNAINQKESKLTIASKSKDLDSLKVPSTSSILPQSQDAKFSQTQKETLRELSDRYAKEKNYEQSLAYYKLYQQLTQKMEADSISTAAESMQKEAEIRLLKQQKRIADLNVEVVAKEKQRLIQLRNRSLLIALLVLIATLVTLYFYFSKKREHKKLSIAYKDLDTTKVKLEGAEQKIVKLLSQHVSGDIARELLMDNTDKPIEKRFVCIMFLDIRDFTRMAERMSPEELIAYQNNVFGFMIDIVQKFNGNINQLLGDGFMATFGAPVSHGNDCQNAFLAATEILKEVKERSDVGVIKRTKIGIGLHAGYVVTGNVGNEARKQYSVTGNPVIIASRVEQLNKEYKTQLIITEEVYTRLSKPLELNRPFLEVEVKGRSNPIRILRIA
jgi:class 3 adenylate cyclase/tetratricopeptide (TPR) repeat protein